MRRQPAGRSYLGPVLLGLSEGSISEQMVPPSDDKLHGFLAESGERESDSGICPSPKCTNSLDYSQAVSAAHAFHLNPHIFVNQLHTSAPVNVRTSE
jgi:hypothetical protein